MALPGTLRPSTPRSVHHTPSWRTRTLRLQARHATRVATRACSRRSCPVAPQRGALGQPGPGERADCSCGRVDADRYPLQRRAERRPTQRVGVGAFVTAGHAAASGQPSRPRHGLLAVARRDSGQRAAAIALLSLMHAFRNGRTPALARPRANVPLLWTCSTVLTASAGPPRRVTKTSMSGTFVFEIVWCHASRLTSHSASCPLPRNCCQPLRSGPAS